MFLDFFLLFGGKGWRWGWLLDFFLFRRFFFLVWGKRAFGTWGVGLVELFKIWNFFYCFKFRVLGSGGACFGFF